MADWATLLRKSPSRLRTSDGMVSWLRDVGFVLRHMSVEGVVPGEPVFLTLMETAVDAGGKAGLQGVMAVYNAMPARMREGRAANLLEAARRNANTGRACEGSSQGEDFEIEDRGKATHGLFDVRGRALGD
jgi:hypothetical protein